MKLHFMVVRRVPPMPSPVLTTTYEILRGRGYTITEDIAEELLRRPDELVPNADLYLLKSHTELARAVAGILHVQGAHMLNPYEACSAVQSKIITSRLLHHANIPVPKSWITGDLALAAGVLDEHPIIVKPHMGHRGTGVHYCKTVKDLAQIPTTETPMIVQEWIDGPGEDLKVYVAGDEVHGVRKRFSKTSFAVPGKAGPTSDNVREIALKVGKVCGLGLYGLDIIESERGPFVVDVNYFPGYKGVPDAAGMIADYIDAYAQGEVTLTPPHIPVAIEI